MYSVIIIGVSLGLLGGLHCIGMCGPVVAFIHSKGALKANVLIYNAGRLITYILIGVIFRLIGSGLELAGLQRGISIATGMVILAFAVSSTLSNSFSLPLAGSSVLKNLRVYFIKLKESKQLLSFFGLGLLNGLLPCGLIYVAIAAAFNTENVLSAAVLMGSFGLGTLPIMSIIGLGSGVLSKFSSLRFGYMVPFISILVGSLLIIRGMALDIPYMSPILTNLDFGFGITTCGKP